MLQSELRELRSLANRARCDLPMRSSLSGGRAGGRRGPIARLSVRSLSAERCRTQSQLVVLALLCGATTSWKAYQGTLETAGRLAPVASLVAATSAGVLYLTTHLLKYQLAHLATKEEMQKQSEEQRKQNEELQKALQSGLASLRADLRADLRAVPVLEGRTEALLAGRVRRTWWGWG